MSNKRIIFINQSPNSMLLDIAAAKKDAGYDCILISGKKTGSKFFISEVELTSYNRASAFTRLHTWLSFFRQTLRWLKLNVYSSDELFIVSNPPFNLYIPWFQKKMRQNKIDLLIYDLYPDIIQKMSTLFAIVPSRILSSLNRKSFNLAAAIYTPSQTLSNAVNKYTDKKAITVYNWVNTDEYIPISKRENKFLKANNLSDKFIVLYSGNLGRTHDWQTIKGAAHQLIGNPIIQFVFIGDGENMDELKRNASSNMHFFDWQEPEVFTHSIAGGDLAWIGYLKGFEDYSIPSKLPFYLSTGTPVISIGNRNSELADILVRNSMGYAVESNDVETLCSLILKSEAEAEALPRNEARQYAVQHFSSKNALLFK